jgi:hypothetical protein
MYLTGDLGFQRPDGSFVLIGRADSLVKIRGQFVNPNEVEAALLEVPGVQHAAAVARQANNSADMQLAAYVSPRPGAALAVSEIFRVLAARLAPRMIPHSITLLDEMPLTVTGKADRKALPEPERRRPDLAAVYRAPATALERYLVGIWESVLALSGIGVHDPFLELGGDSLRAMQVANLMQPLLGDFIFVSALFQAPTVAEFADYLREHYSSEVAKLDAGSPVSPEQAAEVEALIELAKTLPEADVQRLLRDRQAQ